MKLHGSKNWKKERKEKYILIGFFLLCSIIAFPVLLPFYVLFAFAGGLMWLVSVVSSSYDQNKIKKMTYNQLFYEHKEKNELQGSAFIEMFERRREISKNMKASLTDKELEEYWSPDTWLIKEARTILAHRKIDRAKTPKQLKDAKAYLEFVKETFDQEFLKISGSF